MCYNFENQATEEELAARFEIEQFLNHHTPARRFTISHTITAVTEQEGSRTAQGFEWGFVPFFVKTLPKVRPANARADTAATNGLFREAFKSRRCIVPVTGFYEWDRGPKGKKKLIPVHPCDGGIIALPGLWSSWTNPTTGEKLQTATILTTDPNSLMVDYHDRMPVILDRDDEEAWLASDTPVKELQKMLLPCPSEVLRIGDPICPSLLAESV